MVIKFDDHHANVTSSKFDSLYKKAVPEISSLNKAKRLGYTSAYASINLADDGKMLRKIKSLSKRYSSIDAVVVVGIGGSNLGTIAVYEALYGKLYNETKSKKVYFLDTVDAQSMHDVLELFHESIRANKKYLFVVISKSGGTTETVANFEVLFRDLLQKNISVSKSVVTITNKDSALWRFSDEFEIPVLEIPLFVGGRYSVLSPVSLFPLAVLGVDITALLRGAREIQDICLLPSRTNPALRSAISLYAAHKKGFSIAETFLFGPQYESLGKWYRQLMGESLGKEHDLKGKTVWNGMTPTVAVGSTDLHSMAQLYLGGPRDKFVMFILPKTNAEISLPIISEFERLVPNIQGVTFSKITDAIVDGIQAAFITQKRPFSTITFDKTPSDIGAWLQFKMFEIMYLARLMNVNPFDQPNVEEYKIVTKKVLAHK